MPFAHFRGSKSRRRGSATVEFAVCLPLLVLVVLATVEACSMIFLQQALTAAAYEGAREGARSGKTASAANRCQQVLDARRLSGATISVSPPSIEGAASGTYIVVSASAPCGTNGVFSPMFYTGRALTARCTVTKE